MFKALKQAHISAFGLVGLQSATREQIASAQILVAAREAQAGALVTRAEQLEATADTFRDEAHIKKEEAKAAGRWIKKLESTLA